MTNAVATAALIFTVLACSGGASAEAQVQAKTTHVSFRDLNLASVRGRMTLHRRVSWAINSVCDVYHRSSEMIQSAEDLCRRETAAQVTPKIEQVIALANTEQRLAMVSDLEVTTR